MSAWLESMGLMAWPLLTCSLLAMVLTVERAAAVAELRPLKPQTERSLLGLIAQRCWLAAYEQAEARLHPLIAEGLTRLLDLRDQPRAVREEALNLWLGVQRDRLLGHLSWLRLTAAVSPLLGLLGTVLGIGEAFGAIARHDGPVTPALIAAGLHQALATTIFGLSIAVPALVAAHALQELVRAWLERLAEFLGRAQLALDGAPLRALLVETTTPAAPPPGTPEAWS